MSREPLKPFTLRHFELYTSRLVLDTNDYWQLEDFQGEIVEPILWSILNEQVQEVWTLIPVGNSKTTLMAGMALYCADFSFQPWIPVAAASRDQAEILAQQAYQMVRSSPGMLDRFRIFEGYRRIQPKRKDHPGPGSRGIKVYAADVGTNDGVIPFPLALCDEMHRWPSMALYRLWKDKLRKRRACIAGISTAGVPGSEFEQMRNVIRDKATTRVRTGAHLRCEGSGMVMHEWMVEKNQVTDMRAVKDANPLSTITVESLTEDFNSPTVDRSDWNRLRCNIPARSTNAAISEIEWDNARLRDGHGQDADIPVLAEVVLGVDAAWQYDTFAIVPVWQAPDETIVIGDPEVLVPPRDGSMMHPDEVKAAFDRLMALYTVNEAVLDMHHAADTAAWLESERRVTVVAWAAQSNVQAGHDYQQFMAGLRNGRLKHTGSSTLRAHVLHAVSRALPHDQRRFDRPSQSRATKKQDERVIDALTAASMGYTFLATRVPQDRPLAGAVEDYRIAQL